MSVAHEDDWEHDPHKEAMREWYPEAAKVLGTAMACGAEWAINLNRTMLQVDGIVFIWNQLPTPTMCLMAEEQLFHGLGWSGKISHNLYEPGNYPLHITSLEKTSTDERTEDRWLFKALRDINAG